MANYIYDYDPTNQTLKSKGSKALLKLDKDGKLLVLGRDLGNVKDGNGITTWTHLSECDIIEENQVWYQDRNIHKYGIGASYAQREKYIYNGYQEAIYSNNQSYHSSDLINWTTKGHKKHIAMKMPSKDGGIANLFWHNSGYYGQRSGYYAHKNVYFKGKLYIIGGSKGWCLPDKCDHTHRYSANFDKVKIIDWGKDGNNVQNWLNSKNDIVNLPESGKSMIDVYLYREPKGWNNSTGERIYDEKIYIKVLGGYYWNFRYKEGNTCIFYYDWEQSPQQNIYSTTGVSQYSYKEVTNFITNIRITNSYGSVSTITTNITITNTKTAWRLDWQKENSLPSSAYRVKIDGVENGVDCTTNWGPKIEYLPTTPKPVNWVYDTNENLYYKVGDIGGSYSVSFGGKTYYLPIPPANEIYKEAYDGKTNFTITDEHIKNAGKNQFMFSKVNPTNAKQDDWKLIAPYEYTGYSMVWNMGSQNYLFNVKNEIYQLMDYSYLNYFDYTSYNNIINELRRLGKTERENAEKYSSKYYYYYRAMYYEAQADILEAISKKGGYIKPEHAVTHYKIDFMHH